MSDPKVEAKPSSEAMAWSRDKLIGLGGFLGSLGVDPSGNLTQKIIAAHAGLRDEVLRRTKAKPTTQV